MRLAIVFLLSACATSNSSEPRSCTDIGCVSGYTLDFSAASWAQGTYTVELKADDQAGTCTASLPLDPSSQSSCTLAGVRLGLSGSMLPASQQSLVGLSFSGQPKKVEVTVKLDGKTLGAASSFTPAYTTSQPNGPGCEPVCTGARDTLTL